MGGSGGGGGPYYDVSREQLKERVKEARDEMSKDFVPSLQSFLDQGWLPSTSATQISSTNDKAIY